MKKLTLSNEYISSFCLQTALLIHAGIGLEDGIHLLAEDAQAEQEKELLLQIATALEEGQAMSDAMAGTGCFPEYVIHMTAVGERTGRTEQAFRSMADYYESQRLLGNRIRSALVYPSVLLVLMLGIIGVLLVKVLPIFHQVYEQLGGDMTGLAGGLFVLGQFLEKALPVIGILVALGFVFAVVLRFHTGTREGCKRLVIRLTEERSVMKKISAARFTAAMAMGMKSGLMAEDALELAAAFQQAEPKAAKKQEHCRELILEGKPLADALRESGLLEPVYCRMLALGSKSGAADSVMDEIARRLDEEAQIEIEKLVGRVEPTIVILASLLVGAILLAVMLPLMNIMSSIG